MIRLSALTLVLSCVACGDGGLQGKVPGEEIAALSAQQLSGPCSGTVDLGGDGTVDQRWTMAYSNGGLHEDDILADINGTTVEASAYDVDHSGQLTSFVDTYQGYRTSGSWQYDSFGRLVRDGSDGDGDGVEEYVENVSTWTGAGQPLTSAVSQPNVTPYTTTYSYDADGRLSGRVAMTSGGTLVYRTTVVYDDVAGTRTRTRTDPDSNRQSVAVSRFAGGRLIETTFSTPSNPNATTTTYSYAWDGDRIRREVATTIFAGQTTTDHITDYSYACR